MLTALTIFALLALLGLLIGGAIKRFDVSAAKPKRLPAYKLVRRIERADAARALEIFRGDHGLFRFNEMKWYGPTDDPFEDEGYWAPATCSGLYESAAAAERDARAEIVWLRDVEAAGAHPNTNTGPQAT